jgi:hypothetical protein
MTSCPPCTKSPIETPVFSIELTRILVPPIGRDVKGCVRQVSFTNHLIHDPPTVNNCDCKLVLLPSTTSSQYQEPLTVILTAGDSWREARLRTVKEITLVSAAIKTFESSAGVACVDAKVVPVRRSMIRLESSRTNCTRTISRSSFR